MCIETNLLRLLAPHLHIANADLMKFLMKLAGLAVQSLRVNDVYDKGACTAISFFKTILKEAMSLLPSYKIFLNYPPRHPLSGYNV